MSDGPEKFDTKKIPQTEILLGELKLLMKNGFDQVNERFTRVESAVDMLVEDGKTSNQRTTRLEVRLEEYERRATSKSERVRSLSETDLRHDAELVNERAAREALAAEVVSVKAMLAENNETTAQIKKAVSGFLREHPQIVAGLVGVIMSALGYAAAWFSGGHHP